MMMHKDLLGKWKWERSNLPTHVAGVCHKCVYIYNVYLSAKCDGINK